MPVAAAVGSGSLLGGDAQVNLIPGGNVALIKPSTPGPKAKDCKPALVLCEGATVQGQQGASLDSVTASMQRLLEEAEKQKLITSLVTSAKEFDALAKEAKTVLGQLGDELDKQLEGLEDKVDLPEGLDEKLPDAADALGGLFGRKKKKDGPN